MKNYLLVYPAIFTHTFENDNEYYEVEFIDFELYTFGDSLKDAFFMAEDILGGYFCDNTKIPKPTIDFTNIKLEENQFINFVSVDINEYRKKHRNQSIKKTLSIPEWLNELAESENINFSQTLQEALKNKLEID